MTKLDQDLFEDGSPSFVQLEVLVDRVGLQNVVYALALICRHKAEHIRTNWQDEALANLWEHDAKILDKTKTWNPV